MSFDEHTIPRWTKKFSIPKGYVTTRNKYMRCEKLYLGYETRNSQVRPIKSTSSWREAWGWVKRNSAIGPACRGNNFP